MLGEYTRQHAHTSDRDFPVVVALMPATSRQRAVAVGVVVALFALAALVAPFANVHIGRIDSFGFTQLSSGRFAIIETLSGDGGLGFSLVPWQPVLDKRIGQHISGLMRSGGDIEWSFGRKRGLGL
jgi:Protein of unknown function (DUF3363)